MTTELMLPEQAFFALKEADRSLPMPFAHDINLGEYEVWGLEHLNNPQIEFGLLREQAVLTVRTDGKSCEIVCEEIRYGHLHEREGKALVRLLNAGKRIDARVSRFSGEGLLPRLWVELVMKEV